MASRSWRPTETLRGRRAAVITVFFFSTRANSHTYNPSPGTKTSWARLPGLLRRKSALAACKDTSQLDSVSKPKAKLQLLAAGEALKLSSAHPRSRNNEHAGHTAPQRSIP